MPTIHKFPLMPVRTQKIALPAGAKFLCLQTQRGTPCLWYEVSPIAAVEEKLIRVFGTGQPFEGLNLKYLGTFQAENPVDKALFVGHVYQEN